MLSFLCLGNDKKFILKKYLIKCVKLLAQLKALVFNMGTRIVLNLVLSIC